MNTTADTSSAEDLNEEPNERAYYLDSPSAGDICADLNNYIPFGTVTGDLKISHRSLLVKWPSRDEWQECDLSRTQKLIGQYEAVHRPFAVLLRCRLIRVFGRRHQQNPQKVVFRVYGKIHENVSQMTRR